MNNTPQFDWIAFYMEFADKLLAYKEARTELIEKIKSAYERINMKLPTLEKDNNLVDIDPFTIFGLFNKGITNANRIRILRSFAEEFSVSAKVPEHFDGIPVLNNLSATFYCFIDERGEQDIENLWKIFAYALSYADTGFNREEFVRLYDLCIKQKGVKWNLTLGLFWIRPYEFINLDSLNRAFIANENHMPADFIVQVGKIKFVPSCERYLQIISATKAVLQKALYPYSTFPELSSYACITQNMPVSYYPTPEQYTPNLSKDDWKKFILEIELPHHPSPMKMLKGMMELGGEASCKKLSEFFGGSSTSYIGCAVNLGKRAKKYFNLSAYISDGREKFYVIPFLGRDSEQDYRYRIRPELLAALEEIDLSDIDPYQIAAAPEEIPTAEIFPDDPISDDLPEVNASCDSVNYWWLNANPKIWSFSKVAIGEKQSYTLYNDNGNKRRIFQNFLDAKVGDIVIGYESNPVKQIVALAVVSKANDGRNLYFTKVENLASPVDYSTLKECKELENMEFFAQPQGSLFKLTKEEFDFIMDLIRESNPSASTETAPCTPYLRSDFLRDVFMTERDFDTLTSLIRRRKNVILQGAPGVGKTFAAERLAYAIMGEKDTGRVQRIQFHQNYSYEDFIMGYRPQEDGSFKLTHGVFYQFCQAAANQPKKDFFFLIDEINRGNMSRIFGELLMLIENSHRGESITLAYNQIPFSVPDNVHIIGMMNTADRSLALIDYALRRRFSFFEMKAGFDAPSFIAMQQKIGNSVFDRVILKIKELNAAIEKDDSLGSGFCIGHSYFCPPENPADGWLSEVVHYDILPMLREYWFDDKDTYEKWADRLTEVLS